MFVEKLTTDQVEKFLIQNTACEEDIKVEFLEGTLFLCYVTNYKRFSHSKKQNRIITMTDHSLTDIYDDTTWCSYLYKIFGEEYMRWYEECQKQIHKKIFGT